LLVTVLASAMLSLGLREQAEAYESGSVTDGAIVQGKVTLKGTVPEPKEFKLHRYPVRAFWGEQSDRDGHRLLKEVSDPWWMAF